MKIRIVFLLLVVCIFGLQAVITDYQSEALTFDVVSPEITVNSPAGGEVYSPDEIAEVNFEINEDSFNGSEQEQVFLHFFIDGEHNAEYDAVFVAADTLYSYEWPVPEEISDSVYAAISAVDYFGNVGSGNSGSFEISDLDADFSADFTEGNAPLEVDFTDLSIGNITSWAWDFQNDGVIDSEEQNPVWMYEQAGVYSVSLTVSDDEQQDSDTEVKFDYITVNELPTGNVHNLTQETWYETIQDGIDNSLDNDTLIVNPGTYYENINFNGKAIVLGSLFYTTLDTSYISQTIIDGNQVDSVVKFESGEDSSSVLTGFTITNGIAENGGGIYLHQSSPRLAYVSIANNSAEYGGGIYCHNYSNPIVDNVTIANNSSNFSGGGILIKWYSNPNLENMNISNNHSYRNGGGIYYWLSNSTIKNSSIINNIAEDEGGGIYCSESSLNLENVNINNNQASVGGGICYDNSNYSNLINVTITNNTASFIAGGICNYETSLFFSNEERCNIFFNNTENRGGGNDIYSSVAIELIVDTFTVINPTDFHTLPIDNFTFDILGGKLNQT